MATDPAETSGVRSSGKQASDQRVRSATGRSRSEWFAALDAAGARDWGHAPIARWLASEHDVDRWWAQHITVAYEQHHGLRKPGQQSDGTWSASASKTLPAAPADVWPYIRDEAARASWLTGDWVAVSETASTVRLTRDDRSRASIRLDPVAPGADGQAKVRISVEQGPLPGPDEVADVKAEWKAAFATLAAQLG